MPLRGFEGVFSGHPIYVLTYVLTFGAGQKNNQCHGPVALVRMATLKIHIHVPFPELSTTSLSTTILFLFIALLCNTIFDILFYLFMNFKNAFSSNFKKTKYSSSNNIKLLVFISLMSILIRKFLFICLSFQINMRGLSGYICTNTYICVRTMLIAAIYLICRIMLSKYKIYLSSWFYS